MGLKGGWMAWVEEVGGKRGYWGLFGNKILCQNAAGIGGEYGAISDGRRGMGNGQNF